MLNINFSSDGHGNTCMYISNFAVAADKFYISRDRVNHMSCHLLASDGTTFLVGKLRGGRITYNLSGMDRNLVRRTQRNNTPNRFSKINFHTLNSYFCISPC